MTCFYHTGSEPKKGEKNEIPWCFSQVKGTIEDEVADGKLPIA